MKFLTDSTGLTDEYAYDSFGVLKNQSGNTDNTFRYTGEQFDSTLNMYNLRARYYAPDIGRFYGLDTYQGQQSDPESLHKYLYTSNDPINMIDPTGHFGIMGVSISLNISGSIRATGIHAGRQQLKGVVTDLVKALGPRAMKRELKKCIKKKSSCRIGLPILVLGGNTPTLTEHVQDAMAGAGSTDVFTLAPFFLHHYDRKGKRGYVNESNNCSAAKKIQALAKYGDAQCDEYPMFKTQEGGKNKSHVSYRYVATKDNQIAGGAYGGLVSGSRLKSGRKKSFIVVPILDEYVPTFPVNVRRK